jgi:hypothetical protein
MKLLLGLLFIVNSLLIAATHEPVSNSSQPPQFATLFRIIELTQDKNNQKVSKDNQTPNTPTDSASKKNQGK